MNRTTVILLVLMTFVVAGCKKQVETTQTTATAPTTGVQEEVSNASPFTSAADRYLIDAKAIKQDCATLLGQKIFNVFNKEGKSIICGKMSVDINTTRQLIDIAHGINQQSPWDGDENMVSGIFGIADNYPMSVILLQPENAIVFIDSKS